MINYREYPEIAAMATVRVINFHDEHEGTGISLKQVADKGYNAFRLVRFSENYSDKDCIAAIEDYIAVTNTERFNNGISNMLTHDQILVMRKQSSGHIYAVPFQIYKDNKHSMFSGIYVIGDSSMSDLVGHHYPIGIHNRQEH